MAISLYGQVNPFTIEIIKLSAKGLSDREIGLELGYSSKTIYRYRRSLNIPAGRTYKKGWPRKSSAKRRMYNEVTC